MGQNPARKGRQRVREIFAAALACEDSGERLRLLDAMCDGDSGLRSEVDELLRESTRMGGFLEQPAVRESGTGSGSSSARAGPLLSWENPGDQVGPYHLVDLLGEGGGGSVYQAEQRVPVRRTVALKILKLGMDTKSVIARFEAERQALALMDHPNIAKVLDAGATEGGRPYFVMDYVPGEPITGHCDANTLAIDERVSLFIKVCRAVEHAHQKGIVHRDLKPSNILVAWQDGEAVPKIIDFGVAKAIDPTINGDGAVTQVETLIGTPAYMSPEQAERRGFDIDTRSDVYSLGILLYELLTGYTPLDGHELGQVGIDQLRRLFREVVPARPSVRLQSAPRAERPKIEFDRASTIEKLVTRLRGDLDWVVMKCLERDRSRRFGSASELALDLERYLEGAPVTARPPSPAYRLGKFVRRHRTVVGAGFALLLTLIVAVAVSAALAIRARKAEGVQSELRAEAVQDRERALRSAATARLHEYVADINVGEHALADGNIGKVLSLLERQERGSPDGTDLRGFEWRYLLGRCLGDPHRSLPRRQSAVTSLVYSPDGDHLAIGTRDEVLVWDVRDDRSVASLPGGVSSMAFLSEGDRLAVASRNGVWVYNLDPPQPVLELRDHGGALAVSPDGLLLATSDRRGVTIWDAATWSPWHHLPGGSGPLAFSPDGEVLATGSRDGLTLWSMDDIGRKVVLEDSSASFRGPLQGGGSIAFTPDGSQVIAPSRAGGARGRFSLGVWDARTGREVATLPAGSGESGHTGIISSLDIDRGGALLATSSWDHSLRLWDLESRVLLRSLHGHRGEVWSVALAPGGGFVASGGKDGVVKIWPVREAAPPDAIGGTWKPLRFSDDGRYVAALNREGSITIFNTQSCEAVYSIDVSETESRFGRSAVSLSADLAVLAEGMQDGSVRIRWLDRDTEVSIPAAERRVDFVALSPGAETLVAGGWSDDLRWWDLADPDSPALRLPGSQAVFSADGGTLALVTREGVGSIWDTATRSERVRIVHEAQAFGSRAALSPDGKLIAMTHGFDDFENAISLWDTSTGARVGTLTGHKQEIWSVAFSPDGKTLATSSGDGTLRLWNVASRRELLTIGEPGLSLADLLFSPGGEFLVGGSPAFSTSGELRIFRAPLVGFP